MNDTEFDIMDELYFIKNLGELETIFRETGWNMVDEIWNLLEKKWVKAMDENDNELVLSKESYLEKCRLLRFNATKQGLFAHNQI